MITTNVTLMSSPYHSNMEAVGDIVFKLFVPYSHESLTLKVHPYFSAYDSRKIHTVSLHLLDKPKTVISIDHKEYELELVKIDMIKEGQNFFVYYLKVSYEV